MTVSHSNRAHALLGASSAYRWLACPASARLEETFPETTTAYAEEGTRAHELAQQFLENFINGGEDNIMLFSREEQIVLKELEPYTDFIIEKWNGIRSQHPEANIFFEQKLDFSQYVPDGFGTGDVLIIYDDVMEVIDLKFGKGVKVDATNNPQLRLYGLGAYLAFGDIYDFTRVIVTIHQPRLDHVSSEELTVDELLDWAENSVKPTAQLAYNGEGGYHPGDHCRFCKAAAVCRARAEANLALAKMEFRSADILDDEEIAEVLTKASELAKWAEAIEAYALKEAVAGREFPGFKIVEGRSNRTITDPEKAVKILVENGTPEPMLYERKLLSMTALEKVVGKKSFTELLKDLIEKKPGKPALVPSSDKRPAFVPAAVDFADVVVEDE